LFAKLVTLTRWVEVYIPPRMSTPIISIDQLKRAIVVAEQIQALQAEYAAILGNRPTASAAAAPSATKGRKRRKMSPEARARIVAAQKARWAKIRSGKAAKAPAAKAPAPARKKRTITPEGRARLAAAMKARWEAAKKSGGPAPTKKKK
jgi:hypothetical protein